MSEFIQEFFDFLHSEGFAPAPDTRIIADDKIHRFRSNGERNSSAVFQLRIDGDYAVGWAMSFKLGGSPSVFTSKTTRKISADERRAVAEKIKLRKAEAEAERLKAQADAENKAIQLWERGSEGDTAYSKRKGISTEAARVFGDRLLVPVYDGSRLVNIQTIAPDGSKRFLRAGRTKGCYLAIGEFGSHGDVVLCEGYSTGMSIRMATGLPVVVCFSAGNLLPVARKFVKKYTLILAADDDRATVVNGMASNTGLLAAQEVVRSVGGRVCVPSLSMSVEQPVRSVDFNDLHLAEGLEVVRRQILSPATDEFQQHDYSGYGYDEPQDSRATGAPFRVLGYNGANYYYLPREKGQIVAIPSSGHTIANLIQIAPLEYWESTFLAKSVSQTALFAANFLLRACEREGVFDPSEKVRGVGVWRDNDRVVVHGGDYLNIGGNQIATSDIESRYVYEIGKKTIQLSGGFAGSRAAVRLRDLCESLSWEHPMSGALLAGFLVVAPVCAALKWRPHIWISGESGSGKTTIIESIVTPVLGEMALRVDGGTTEPALRQLIGYSGRPIIYDEAEAENRRDSEIMAGVLQLVRRSSSGGTIAKWGANGASVTTVRSCFCFSAINPSIHQRADESRISLLNLKRRDDEAAFEKLMMDIDEIVTPEFSRSLLLRTIQHMDSLLKNCDSFTKAAAVVLGDRRAADQIGTMLAGLYLLSRTDVITAQAAVEWIRKHDWSSFTAVGETSDPLRLISAISMHRHRMESRETTIGTLVSCALGDSAVYIDETADRELRSIGIRVDGDSVIFSNTSDYIRRVLSGTPWYASWKRSLGDIEGAEKTAAVYFSPGHTSRGVSVPARYFREGK